MQKLVEACKNALNNVENRILVCFEVQKNGMKNKKIKIIQEKLKNHLIIA